MAKAIKQNGKYVLEKDRVISARIRSKEDLQKVMSKLSEQDLRDLLERILTRLTALESS